MMMQIKSEVDGGAQKAQRKAETIAAGQVQVEAKQKLAADLASQQESIEAFCGARGVSRIEEAIVTPAIEEGSDSDGGAAMPAAINRAHDGRRGNHKGDG